MAQLNPYLAFNGNCREAMTFYQECLGGELALQAVGESPAAAHMPAEVHVQILHSSLTQNGTVLLFASDMLNATEPIQGNTVTLCLNCHSEEEINTYFGKLAADATVSMPLKTEFWGATFGQLTDKFGVQWMLNFDHAQNA